MECLAKVRRRGEQKVTVEHVHVYPGGQAVVGNVTQTGNREGVGAESEHQAYGLTGFSTLEYAPSAAMWSEDESRDALPVSRPLGQEALPQARRGKGQRRASGPS
jgi:hypothetical protein